MVWCTHIFAEVSLTMESSDVFVGPARVSPPCWARAPMPRLLGSSHLALTQHPQLPSATRRNTMVSTLGSCTTFLRLWGTALVSRLSRRPEALVTRRGLGGAAALRRCDWARLQHRALDLTKRTSRDVSSEGVWSLSKGLIRLWTAVCFTAAVLESRQRYLDRA